jgi:hypothetical protein
MAVRRPEPPFPDVPDDATPAEFDERRWEELLRIPGVVVRRRDPNQPIEPFVPLTIVSEGAMTHDDLLRLLGRRDDEVPAL